MNKSLVILAVSLVASLNLHAIVPVLDLNTNYNSGYAGSTPLAAGSSDTDFSINGALPPLVAFPIPGAWVTAPGVAQWISPSEDQAYPPPPTEGNLPGDYTYETSFVNNFLVATDVTISGSYAADNSATVFVDGNVVATGPTSPTSQYSFLTPFTITLNVNPGAPITVSFVVRNYNSDNSDPAQSNDGLLNPTGLLVTNLKATVTPEPSTYAMLFAGLGALVLVRRTRRATVL